MECPFCAMDPFDYVNVGIGVVPVAVTCCVWGILHIQEGYSLEMVQWIKAQVDSDPSRDDIDALIEEWREAAEVVQGGEEGA